MADITGRCFCGAVRYATPGPVLWAGHCHCDSCRRATSAPFTSFFGVPRASVRWEGELKTNATSNGRVKRLFCGACGTQMTYQYEGWPDETHLYAATLDNPQSFAPKAHFHYAEKLPWVRITDDLPKYPGSADTTEPL
ncbi:GFA family protein [Roseovarius faecimaris]|uniref:GFA family protein n=1 Tax=Roseovarius faecimaris TaxID=2494550 RepID=A0A6I6IRG2_9RHOB|nr:GFA family protein [Roseovarius faecimaris]QGX98812.1 GFA family protein [Roseovarius faecimaris]